MNDAAERLIRRPEVETLCGIGATSIYKFMAAGRFPRPIKLSPKAVRWRLSEVNAWIAAQTAEAA